MTARQDSSRDYNPQRQPFGSEGFRIWQHAFALGSLAALFVLALAANVCYCAAHVVDIALQYSSYRARWLRWRWALWLSGMLFAVLVADYWIADEIYPDMPPTS
jgi:hypothetical protein